MNIVRIHCPICKAILNPIVLLSAFDYPNEYRTATYFCIKCSANAGVSVLYFFSFIKLKEFEQKGKFPSIPKYSQKLANFLQNQRFLRDEGLDKRFCPDCKEPLVYDREGSNITDKVKIRCFFHFDCKRGTEHNKIFFFITQRIEQITIHRVVLG